jgi:hypothetical protein
VSAGASLVLGRWPKAKIRIIRAMIKVRLAKTMQFSRKPEAQSFSFNFGAQWPFNSFAV